MEANYQTALNDAMMNAVKQLKDFTKKIPGCKRYHSYVNGSVHISTSASS